MAQKDQTKPVEAVATAAGRPSNDTSGAERRAAMICALEQAWVSKETEAATASARATQQHGLLGRLGFTTAAG